jgi:hypothetical protein
VLRKASLGTWLSVRLPNQSEKYVFNSVRERHWLFGEVVQNDLHPHHDVGRERAFGALSKFTGTYFV